MRILLTLLLICLIKITSGQNINITAENTSLNKLLLGLRDQYKLQLSFDNQLLSNYNVSISGTFQSPQAALEAVIKPFPLKLKVKDKIFIIYPSKELPANKLSTFFAGQIAESGTFEPLPFAYVTLNNRVISSDIKGIFSTLLPKDTSVTIKISHLGHYLLDTTVVNSGFHRFFLTPSAIGLREIVVKDKEPDRSTQIGDRAGRMKINHQIAKHIPGNDDNSVYNFMRLQPGVVASSEQSNGLMIWGSYEGQNKIMFDDFTIWGLKSFHDDINLINPLIVKDIEILKGGFDASYGDRVGGIVRISGKDGNLQKPSVYLNINNVTVNGMVEVPIFRNSAILLSFRQTYYNLYDGKDVVPLSGAAQIPDSLIESPEDQLNIKVNPDYNFQDANFKFTTRNKKGDQFYISLMGGRDKFKYKAEQKKVTSNIAITNFENNLQTGASIFYGKVWQGGNTSNLSASWAELDNKVSDLTVIDYPDEDEPIKRRDNSSQNLVREFKLNADNWFTINRSNKLQFGGGFVFNDVQFLFKSFGVTQSVITKQSPRANLFVVDQLSLPGKVLLNLGLRTDYNSTTRNFYHQPRISTTIPVAKRIKLTGAWGIYNQFISKSSVIDEYGNYHYIWTSSDNRAVPVLRAKHFVFGSSFHSPSQIISGEFYYKTINGLTRFIQGGAEGQDEVFKGDGISYGLDLYAKRDWKGHSVWVSYSLSQTKEKFPYYGEKGYHRSPQDQRHELKLSGIFKLNQFYISGNYVFGSGFPINTGTNKLPIYDEESYNRFDLALFYRINYKQVYGEIGLSLLNLFNSRNIRYSNFNLVPLDQNNTINIYTEAVPFTPRFSLKLWI